MYTVIHDMGVRAFLVKEASYLVVAFILADTFYKWGSFGLEAIGFLAMWGVFSAIGNTVLRQFQK